MDSVEKGVAVLGGGCFWCLEAVFQEVKGVEEVRSGYAGGHVEDPTYRQVCSGTTGHAEVVRVVFDPAVVSFRDLLRVFFTIHDPTTPDRQGADVGHQAAVGLGRVGNGQDVGLHDQGDAFGLGFGAGPLQGLDQALPALGGGWPARWWRSSRRRGSGTIRS